ncbi:oocyte zinc finger 6-like isoform X3 [Micractinium conductrix]|uniref:Oocyte zinc finger 6-like isoform X3 n=1 Tax=Micractinium conductrix TaxID=554055 RepID=A0A2P6VIP1_9CHLO|nr:oocyte zinc finger 6-like isoform X3 [Micractinium conductrix]|eukprot:PSC73966.1 oocyte zinc finger 6-like isoform X3 [Micractinium conductrix]
MLRSLAALAGLRAAIALPPSAAAVVVARRGLAQAGEKEGGLGEARRTAAEATGAGSEGAAMEERANSQDVEGPAAEDVGRAAADAEHEGRSPRAVYPGAGPSVQERLVAEQAAEGQRMQTDDQQAGGGDPTGVRG